MNKKELLKKVNSAVKKLGIVAIDIDTPPETQSKCYTQRYVDFGGDTWYIASKKKLSEKELEFALNLDLIRDFLRDKDGLEYATETALEIGLITKKDVGGKNA